MQRLPNETWLLYLIGGAGLANAQITALSKMHGFVSPKGTLLTELRRNITDYRANNPPVNGVERWPMAAKVIGLVEERPAAIEAREMMMDPKVRPILELMFTAGASIDDVHKYVKDSSAVSRSRNAVALYQHYFWDKSRMTDSLWYSLFNSHPRGAVLRGCYQNGVDYALWKLGTLPNFRPEEVVRRVLAESAMRFMETAHMDPDEATARQAKFWAENIFKANDQLSKSGDALKTVIDEVKSVSLRLGTRNISSLEDLRNGEHST